MKTKDLIALPALALAAVSCSDAQKEQNPNILLIVADDLGLGDVSAYGSQTISTPNIDLLADNGIRFNNGYATSATSTPSRYALFTGMYPWRNADAKILPGDAPLLIPTDIPTMPKMFQNAGYETAAIGKWHLGMGAGNVDWNQEIVPSANTVGFDYTCLIAATNDRVPTVYVEDGKVEGLEADDPIYVSYVQNFEGEPTALTNPEMMKMKWYDGHFNTIVNGIPRIGFMKGGQKARWVDEDMADYFIAKVKRFLAERDTDKPFFLYYGLHQPHVPRAPHQRFVGSTAMGPRGDAVVEADWCVGEVIAHLEKEGLLENTLVIFTSDNGPVVNDGYADDSEEKLGNHDPRNGTRGGKYSQYDGGTHIPFIFYWKGKLAPMVSDAIVCHHDLFASLGKMIGAQVPENIDSQDHLDAFMGESAVGRTGLVHEAQGALSYRNERYSILPPYVGPATNLTLNEFGNLGEWGLFDLQQDFGERKNIAKENPEILEALKVEFRNALDGIAPEKLQQADLL